MEQELILVNEQDHEIGRAGKLEAHQQALLHRAFSIFIFNDKGELLLQRRSLKKYHSAGLWTNTCCSHPTPGNKTEEQAGTRLKEEMGFEASLCKIFDFVYKAEFENGLTEFEFDHVFTGSFNSYPIPDPEEVMDWKYVSLKELKACLQTEPENFTAWLQVAFPRIEEWWTEKFNFARES